MLGDFYRKKIIMVLLSLTLIIMILSVEKLVFLSICGTVTTAFIIRTPIEPTSISKITKVPVEHPPFLTTSTIIRRYMSPPTSNNFMERLSGEDDDSYFKRIMNIASNPESFEKAVLQQKVNASTLSSSSSSVSKLNDTNSTNLNSNNATDSSKPKYVRGEEWDAEERRKATSGSWEERVQYDGQLYGNRYQQNEILRKNLKGF